MGRRRRVPRLRVAYGAALAYESTTRQWSDALAIHEQIKQASQVAELPMPLADLRLPAVTAGETGTGAALPEPGAGREAATPGTCPDEVVEAIKNNDVAKVKELLSAKKVVDPNCTVSFEAVSDWGRLVTVTGVLVHLAARLGQADVVEALLDHQADANAPTTAGGELFSAGTTPLMLAAFGNKLEVVNLLLRTPGIKVNDQNKEGMSALLLAAYPGNIKVVEALLKREDINVNLQDKENATALFRATDKQNYEVVEALLQRDDTNVNLQTKDGSSALMEASKCILLNQAFEMLFKRKDIDVNLQNKDGQTALIQAAYLGNADVVEALLGKKGIKVNLQDQDGYSALIKAISMRYIEATVIHLLLKREDIDINLQAKDGYSALVMAAAANFNEAAKALLERRDIQVNLQNKDGYSALIMATWNHNIEVVRMLLSRNDLEVNLQTKDGNSALMMAVQRLSRQDDHEAGAKVSEALLADERVDVNLADQTGDTALMLAVSNNNLEAVRQLVKQKNIDCDKRNEDGMTPLMLAISRNSEKSFKLLCGKSNATIADKDGATAVVYAADISMFWVNNIYNLCYKVHCSAALLLAARSGHRKALKALRKFLPIHMSDWGRCGMDGEAMLWAARGGQMQTAKWLLEKNQSIDLHCRDEDGNSGLVLAASAGYYLQTKWLLDHGLSVKTDIDQNNTEANQLALWMGVVFAEMRLVKHFVGSGLPWTELWQKPTDCPNADMKETCDNSQSSLLAHARDQSIVHELLDWQFNIDKIYAKTNSDISMHRIGLSSEAKQAIVSSLAYMLREEKSEPALAILSRTDWNWIEDLREDQGLDLNQVRLVSEKDSKGSVSVGEAKCWNLLHWGAFSCDPKALSIAMNFASKDMVKLLDSRPTEGWTDTASEIANKNPHCFRCGSIFSEIMVDWSRQKDFKFFSAHFATIASVGAISFHIFFLQHKSLKKRGWLVMSTVPLPLSAAGFFLVWMPAERGEGSCSISVTSKTLKESVGWLAILFGAALFLGVSATFTGPRPTVALLAIKKTLTNKLDRFWDKANCALAVLMLAVFIIQAAVLLEMGLSVDFSGLVTGLVHTVAVSLPLFIANPRSIAVPLRLATGICFVGLITTIAAKQQPITRFWHFCSERGVVLVGTSLALAWADGIGMLKTGLEKAATVIEIEMSAKAPSSNEKFTASKLVLGHPAMAAQGLEVALGVTPEQLAEGLKDPVEAMRREIVSTGDQNDLENFIYIAEGISGRTSDLPSAVAESLRTGVYHGGTIEPEDFDTGHHGRSLEDWMMVSEVAKAGLSKAEFIAVRFYTSSSFPRVNGPLRKEVRPHPWAMVVLQLDRGIKKLRSVQAQVNPEAFAGETTLWRGMKNLEVDVRRFASVGGTEMAPMSTTTNEDVARHYATSKVPLVFKFMVGGLKTGVSIQFLSLYPKEEEFLYSPLTFLSLKRHYEDDGTTILVVEPVMS